MAQTNYTPIILYNSGTTTNVPSASNLANGELAINYTDGKLFYKDNSSAIQVIGWKTTPTTAGGTGLTSYTAGDLPYYASGSALSKLGIGTSGYVLESNGSAPTWVAQSTLSVGTATNATNTAITDNTSSSATWYPTIVSATTGNLPQTTSSTKLSFVPSTGTLTATNYAGAWAGSTIGTGYGGTGLTSFTSGGLLYASSSSVLASGSILQFDGTHFLVNLTSSGNGGRVQSYNSNGGITYESNVGSGTYYPGWFQVAGTQYGYIQTSTLGTVFNTVSDYRLKTNLQPITNSGTFIDSLKPYTYNWIDGNVPDAGFLAHEVQAVTKRTVIGEKDAVDANGKPMYQAMEHGSSEFMANIIAELQSIRARLKAANIP